MVSQNRKRKEESIIVFHHIAILIMYYNTQIKDIDKLVESIGIVLTVRNQFFFEQEPSNSIR